jgi:tetratricopeptide (TPR) repeat protein
MAALYFSQPTGTAKGTEERRAMAMWDKLFKKKDEDSAGLNPIVQKSPPPSAAPRASAARPAPRPVPAAAPPEDPPAEKTESETKKRKKSESGTKTRATDDQALLKRGLLRQSKGDHDGAIADFSKAIELNGNCVQAYAARGVSREAKGDGAGAKSDYSKSIQLEIMNEINRQMRENPDVEV